MDGTLQTGFGNLFEPANDQGANGHGGVQFPIHFDLDFPLCVAGDGERRVNVHISTTAAHEGFDGDDGSTGICGTTSQSC